MDIFYYILAGAGVGLAVGLTGVGGGSLMTPLLVLVFNFPMHVAVGTDLLYAAITKAGGVAIHRKQRTVKWDIVANLAAGSLPASIVTVIILRKYFPDAESYSEVLTSSLGVMLILTSLVLIFKGKLLKLHDQTNPNRFVLTLRSHSRIWTFCMGVILGIFVTLSSVGAGAFGTAVLFLLFPYLSSIKIIGTDLAHAVPLTLVAGLGHLWLGNVDFALLGALLMGSLPAIFLGTRLATKLPDRVLQPILASALLALGVKYAFF